MADRAMAPVGVFDSGIGGLSVLSELQALLPNETYHFVADCAHIPYGEKSQAYIRERCDRIAEFFRDQGAKALVVACNTATAAAAAHLRERFPDWPIIGMEPAVKPAALATRSGVVGVLATSGTLQSARFAALLDRFASDVKVLTQPGTGLVECIEAGDLDGREVRRLLERYLSPMLEAGCDTIILGCTHYPFLTPLLRQLLPSDISLVDTGAAVARHLQRRLGEAGLLSVAATPRTCYWTSGNVQAFETLLPRLGVAVGPVDAFAS